MNTYQKEQEYRKAQRRVRRLNRPIFNNLKNLFKSREKISLNTTSKVGFVNGVSWYEPKPKWSNYEPQRRTRESMASWPFIWKERRWLLQPNSHL